MKNLNAENETLAVCKAFLKNIGLDIPGVRIEAMEAVMDTSLGVFFTVPVDRFSAMSNKPFMAVFRDLQTSVLNSPLVSHELKLANDKLKMANAASDELLERIKELEKYKTHYELEMKLRHGDVK
jgi:hypothetical protein